MSRVSTLRSRLGLGSRDAVAWALYDWANPAFATTVIAAGFPIYYRAVIGADLPGYLASVYFGYTSATAGLFGTREGEVVLASALFVAGNVGFIGANVFYDSLLTHIEGEDRSNFQ